MKSKCKAQTEMLQPEDQPALGRSAESALARSSAVGSSTDQPLCSTAWAADCTVFRTPALLARVTTVCFRLFSRMLPKPKPRHSGSTWWLMAAWSWKKKKKKKEGRGRKILIKQVIWIWKSLLEQLSKFSDQDINFHLQICKIKGKCWLAYILNLNQYSKIMNGSYKSQSSEVNLKNNLNCFCITTLC